MNLELRSLLICKICNSIYDEPIYLPCHCTICKRHLTDMMMANENVITCAICQRRREITSDSFEPNKQYKLLIESETHLSEHEKLIKRNFEETSCSIQALIEDFHDKEANFELFYKCYLKEILGSIETRRDELIQKIKDISHALITKKVAQIEKHFNLRLENNRLAMGTIEKIKSDEKCLRARLSRDLVDASQSGDHLDALRRDQMNNLSVLQKKIDKFEHLKAKLLKFKFIKPCEYRFKSEYFGYLTYDFENFGEGSKSLTSQSGEISSVDKLILVDSKQWKSNQQCCTCSTTFLGLSE